MQTDQPKTAGEAINELYATLRHLTGPTGLHIIPDPATTSPTSTALRESNVHRLSTISIAQTRRTLSQALDTLKASASARESWPDVSVERILRVKADAVARHRATKTSNTALTLCRRLALTADPFASRCVQAAHRVQAIADDANAATFRDDAETAGNPSCEVSVSGARFIADFSFPDLTASHVAVDVNFRFLITDDNVERPEPSVGRSFADLMHRERFNDLRLALDRLVALETLDDQIPSVSLCDALRAVEDDLLAAAELEAKVVTTDPARPFRTGHGRVDRTALGLRLTFMPRNSALLGVEPARGSREISVARAGAFARHDPPAEPGVQFGEVKTMSVPAQYVLWLRRPVLVSLRVAQMLERIGGRDEVPGRTGNRSMTLGSSRGMSSRDVMSTRDGKSDGAERKGPWPSLQRLLATVVFGGDAVAEEESSSIPSAPTKTNGEVLQDRGLVKERSHWSQQATEYIAAVGLPGDQYVEFSHSGVDMIAGLSVRRIPICHARDVQIVLGLLRQQSMFNELFVSCFGNPLRVEPSMTALFKQAVEVVVSDSPTLMQLSMYDGGMDDILSVAVSVLLGGEVEVKLQLSSGRRHVCSDAKATALLKVSRSIPLTVRGIIELSRAATSAS